MQGWGLQQRVLAIRVSRDPNSRADTHVVVRNLNGLTQSISQAPPEGVFGVGWRSRIANVPDPRLHALKRNQSALQIDPLNIMHKLDANSGDETLPSAQPTKKLKTYTLAVAKRTENSVYAYSTTPQAASPKPPQETSTSNVVSGAKAKTLMPKPRREMRVQTGDAMRSFVSRPVDLKRGLMGRNLSSKKVNPDLDSSVSEVSGVSNPGLLVKKTAKQLQSSVGKKMIIFKPQTSKSVNRSLTELPQQLKPTMSTSLRGMGDMLLPAMTSKAWV